MKKQPEITDKTRQAFVDVFCGLYSAKPIEKISVQEISNKSGYNRSTFYQYFCDIYELLAYVENDVLDCMRKKLESGAGNIQDLIELYEEKGAYLNALLGDHGSNRFAELLKTSFPAHALAPFSKGVAGEAGRGFADLPENDPLTPYLAEFHLSTVLSLFRLWQKRDRDLPQEELLSLILRLYLNGAAAFADNP